MLFSICSTEYERAKNWNREVALLTMRSMSPSRNAAAVRGARLNCWRDMSQMRTPRHGNPSRALSRNHNNALWCSLQQHKQLTIGLDPHKVICT